MPPRQHSGYPEKGNENKHGWNLPFAGRSWRLAPEDQSGGKHGDSQRLLGLDPTNNNAFDRAIVVHSAWYSNTDMIARHGKLCRSQGCFAVGENELAKVFERLGTGRMIYSAKV